MGNFLRRYKMQITALSPIHVGSGEIISKKGYIYTPWDHQVIVPDVQKMYKALQERGKEKEFELYMTNSKDGQLALGQWLQKNNCSKQDYEMWKRYAMDAGEAFTSDKTRRPKEIHAFIKDAYGMPYIPGSTIKGMIRTALIAWKIHCEPDRYGGLKRTIQRKAKEKGRRNQFLLNETNRLEQSILYDLGRDRKTSWNAVSDCMSGLRVGDSLPVKTDCLTLAQKIDYTLQGEEKALPLLRESLSPGTKIYFDITIDTPVFPYSMKDIMEALDYFQKICYKYFYSRFHRGKTESGLVWLGGGCGFLSKTVLYPMLGLDAVEVIDGIYQSTLGKNYQTHKHARDKGLKLAPHVCKCTKYQGQLYDMGMGRIEVIQSSHE